MNAPLRPLAVPSSPSHIAAQPAAHPPLALCELADPGLPRHETYSPFCLKVHRALRLAGLGYTRRMAPRPASHRAFNPRGQVPVLLIGDEAVADSTRILRSIQTLAPGHLDDPRDPRARAEAWLYEELADTSLNGFVVAARWADDRNWPDVREAYFGGAPTFVRAVVAPLIRRRVLRMLHARDVWRGGPDDCWRRYGEVLDALEARAPRSGYWMGERPTVADVALFGQLHSLRTPLTPSQAGQLERRRGLSAYLDRVDRESRPTAPR